MTVLLPKSKTELWTMLAEQPQARIMAGGTDLMVRLRAAGEDMPSIICLERLEEMHSIETAGDTIHIGSGTTMATLLKNDAIKSKLPLLHKAAGKFASPLIRNMATIGGNVCTASPAADALPALYAMEAEVKLRSANGTRTLPINEFITGPGKTGLGSGEILTAIKVAIPEDFDIHHFEKVGQREALAISVVSMAGLLSMAGSVIEDARFAWGSVGPTIVRSSKVENALKGEKLSLSALRNAAKLAQEAVSPINDVRASADYRRQVAGNLMLRLAAL